MSRRRRVVRAILVVVVAGIASWVIFARHGGGSSPTGPGTSAPAAVASDGDEVHAGLEARMRSGAEAHPVGVAHLDVVIRRRDGAPVGGWLVEVFAPSGGRGSAPQWTDGTGAAHFPDLSALRGYAVWASHPDGATGQDDVLHRTVDLSSRGPTEVAFVLPDACIEGVVVDAGTRSVVQGARVRAVERELTASQEIGRFRSFVRSDPVRVPAATTSDLQGRFVLEGTWRHVEVEVTTSDGREGTAYPKRGGGVEVGLVIGVARPQRVELQGVVVDDAERPIVGAEITLRDEPARTSVTATTDASGRFHMPGIAEGAWSVAVRRRDAPETTGIAIIRGEPTIRIVVPVSTALSVTLTDEGTGAPIPGAVVDLWQAIGIPGGDCPMAGTALTDPDGKARVPVSAGTVAHLRVRAPGYREGTLHPPERRSGTLLVIGGSDLASPLSGGEVRPVALQLRRGTVVTGRVRFEDGRPAADAEVRAGEEWAAGGTPTTTTGADGRFRLEGVLPEDGSPADLPVWVVASLYGHASDEAPVLLSASLGTSEAHDVGDLVLHTTGCVRGRVVDEEGRSVGGASVRLSCGVREGRTDVAGHYTLACDSWNQTGKTGALWVSAKGFLKTTVRLALLPSPGNVLDAEPVVLSRVAAIQLRVLDARGEPARGVRVRLRSWTEAADRDEDPVTGGDGFVTLDGVAPDDTLELRAEDGGSFTYFVGSSRVVTVRLPATRHLEGRVVDEAGQPIGSARMHLRQHPDGGEGSVDVPDRRVEVSGADGTFRMETVLANAFSVEVSAPGFVTRRVWIAPDATSPLEVVLERFGEAHRRRLVEIQERIGVIESSLARYASEGHELHLELRDLEEEARRLRGR